MGWQAGDVRGGGVADVETASATSAAAAVVATALAAAIGVRRSGVDSDSTDAWDRGRAAADYRPGWELAAAAAAATAAAAAAHPPCCSCPLDMINVADTIGTSPPRVPGDRRRSVSNGAAAAMVSEGGAPLSSPPLLRLASASPMALAVSPTLPRRSPMLSLSNALSSASLFAAISDNGGGGDEAAAAAADAGVTAGLSSAVASAADAAAARGGGLPSATAARVPLVVAELAGAAVAAAAAATTTPAPAMPADVASDARSVDDGPTGRAALAACVGVLMGVVSGRAAPAATDLFRTWLGAAAVRVVGSGCAAATGGAVVSAAAAWATRWEVPPRAAAAAVTADADAWPSRGVSSPPTV